MNPLPSKEHDAPEQAEQQAVAEGGAIAGSFFAPLNESSKADIRGLSKAYASANALACNRETLVMQLSRQKLDHEHEVARLDELLRLLNANPGTARILELLGRH